MPVRLPAMLFWQRARAASAPLVSLSISNTANNVTAPIVWAHHESYDGSGYPRGLEGDEIPYGARILAVADAYDSMTQPHTQRPAMPPSLAVEEIERCSGRQFDPACAEAMGAVLSSAAAA